MARLSIVVPYWNVETYLTACLQSLQRQTFTDFEAILVDDGSQDSSRELAEKMCADDARFRIVSQPNRGLGPARNTGVLAASGELVTFVDGDDIVPRRAYERMVAALDRTGSDLVAGDARRFSTLGVRDSYVHRHAFAQRRLRTHVRDYPRIALDRMAWNKVIRRAFWDDHGLVFPSIQYEDYPVTIRAHVFARSVDVLPEPVYYWRERDGGDASITQRKWELSNLRDRVDSAVEVLDFLNDEAPELAPTVQAHLRTIDLSTLAAALHANDPPDAPELFDLAERLRSRIDPFVHENAAPFERIQNHLLGRRDLVRLRELMSYRDRHGTSAAVNRHGVRKRLVTELPFRGERRARVPASVYVATEDRFELRSQVLDCGWEDGRLSLDLSVVVGPLSMSPDSTVAVRLVRDGATRTVRNVRRFRRRRQHVGEDLSGVRVEIDPSEDLDAGAPGALPDGFWTIEVSATAHGVERTGHVGTVLAGRARWPTHQVLDDGRWVQPQYRTDGTFGLWVRSPAHRVDIASAAGDSLVLRGTFRATRPGSATHLLLTREDATTEATAVSIAPGATDDLPDDVLRFSAYVPARALVGEWDDHDDPVEEAVSWTPRLVHDGRELVLATAAGFRGAVATVGSRRIAATRTGHGNLMVVESFAYPRVTEVTWHTDDHITVVGRYDASCVRPHRVELRCNVAPDTPIERTLATTIQDDRFRFDVDVAALVAETGAAAEGAATHGQVAARWHLLAHTDAGTVTMTAARETAHTLPANRTLQGREVAFEVGRGDTIAVRIV